MPHTASEHTITLTEIDPKAAALLKAVRECEAAPRLTRDSLKAMTPRMDQPLNGQHLGEGFNRISNYSEAEVVAQEMSARTGHLFIAEDRGSHVSPRYAVIQAPRVGDAASYGFNGDAYPCGFVTKISGQNMRRIETTEVDSKGVSRTKVFWRRKLSASWVEGGTWSLMMGTHNERNPEF